MTLYDITQKVKRLLYKISYSPIIKKSFKSCGKNVVVPCQCSFAGISNISIGNRVFLHEGLTILTTKAKVLIGDDVMFGPNVTIVTGNHRTDIIGRTMTSITDAEKLVENDQDVTIEQDVWIGANVTILKGVTIGKGSIVAAGAVVTHSCDEYSIIGGVPAKKIGTRFSREEIVQHERMVKMGSKE